jgi:hypothetical protein
MADLISKVVRRQDRTDKPNSSSNPSKGTELTSRTRTNNGTLSAHPGTLFQLSTQAKATGHANERSTSSAEEARGNINDAASDSSSDSGINFRIPENGIVKTVAVQTVVEGGRRETEGDRDERVSTTSSTAQLNEYGYVQQDGAYRV